jgi:hypothetical protein
MTVRIAFALMAVLVSVRSSGADIYQHFLDDLKLEQGLPPGYLWSMSRGPDFDIYRASAPDGESRVAVYLGYYGQLSQQLLAQNGEPGRFAGIPVRWYRMTGDGGELEALAFVERYMHASCYESINIQPTAVAKDETALQRLLGALSEVKISGLRCDEPRKLHE